jgi:hypothetical protein
MAAKKEQPPLTADEQDLVDRIGFDGIILQRIKSFNINAFGQLTVYGVGADGFPIAVPAPGFTYNAYQRRAEIHVCDNREGFARQGYRIFLSELGSEDELAQVAVIRGTDHYNILRVMRTEDINGDKTTEDIIARLKRWEQRNPFNIWGANHDWVLAKFRKFPDDMRAFARKVIKFAPDGYSQGDWESEEEYARAMRRERGFYLWWD